MGFTLETGSKAPDFSLRGVDKKVHSLENYKDKKILVIVFSCNHCPYVIGSEDRMIAFQDDYADRGVQLIAINSNETDHHPTDSFEHMIQRAEEKKLNFPYLRDEDQDVAKAYGAMRTPHYFVFDEARQLVYNGRMDDNPRTESAATTRELRDALDAVLSGKPVPVPVTDAIGCNVKWWGKEEHWVPADICDFIPEENP